MSSRKEQKEALRREREERRQAEVEAARRKRLIGYVVAGVLVAALATVGIVLALGGGDSESSASGGDFPKGTVPAREITELDPAVKAAGCELKHIPEPKSGEHTDDPVQYDNNPPMGGPHHPVPAEDGAYLEAPDKESVVHALEHGRVVLQYAPGAPDSTIGGLKALFDEDPYHMLLLPNNTDMPYAVAAVSWTDAVLCKEMNDKVYDALRALKDNFRDQGPEQVP